MDQATFTIELKLDTKMMVITLSGFFSRYDVLRFVCALECNLTISRWKSGQYNTLCDITRINIQSQDVVEAFANGLKQQTPRSAKLAFVAGRSLARAQARRLSGQQQIEFFEDRAGAERWLLS